MNNSTIKFLINLKNASIAKKEFLDIKSTQTIKKLVHLLYEEGLLQSYNFNLEYGIIRIHFRVVGNFSAVERLKFHSTPSKMIHLTLKDVHKIKNSNKIIVLSTIKGFKSVSQCKQMSLGGTACFSF